MAVNKRVKANETRKKAEALKAMRKQARTMKARAMSDISPQNGKKGASLIKQSSKKKR